MLRRQATIRHFLVASRYIGASQEPLVPHLARPFPFCSQFNISFRHFFDYFKVSKEAIEKKERERARLADELSRSYFADFLEISKNGGKIAMANKTLIPSATAVKFPDLEVHLSGGGSFMLPINSDPSSINTDEKIVPPVSLLCLSFRSRSLKMVESWSGPFLDTFNASSGVQVYEVFFLDYWLLTLGWLRQRFLKMTKNISASPQRHNVYSFGDHYYFRKKLQIVNLLTGHIFLLDRYGRIRWQGFGSATDEELSSLFSCTSLLLEK